MDLVSWGQTSAATPWHLSVRKLPSEQLSRRGELTPVFLIHLLRQCFSFTYYVLSMGSPGCFPPRGDLWEDSEPNWLLNVPGIVSPHGSLLCCAVLGWAGLCITVA